MAKFTFDTTTVEATTPMVSTPLPEGVYSVEITNAEMRDLKSGKGQAINVEYTVIDPAEHARRKVWSNLCVVHESPKTEQIAREHLAALCLAVGIEKLEDTDELFGKLLRIQTGFGKGEYADKPEVKAWMTAGVAAPKTPPAAARQSAPAPSASKPWQRQTV